jgi:ABC-type sugar transport system ATPase subunit
MIYVTHDQTEAMTMGQRIAVMHKGVVRQIDRPLEVYRRPSDMFVAAFIGTPSMNLVEGNVSASDGKLVFHSESVSFQMPPALCSVRELCPHGDVTIGARPEDVALVTTAPGPDSLLLGEGPVELVEMLGSEAIVHAALGKATIVFKSMGDCVPARGDNVKLSVPLSRVHLFDSNSQARLEHSSLRS